MEKTWRSELILGNASLINFARGVFDTDGRLLRVPGLPRALTQGDPVAVRKDIERLVKAQS